MSTSALELARAELPHPSDDAVYAAMEPHDPGSFANHATPLVRNCWYAAGRAEEIGRTPLARKLLNVDVVLWRTQAGAPVAMRNRCPHRSFPLARGWGLRAYAGTDPCAFHRHGPYLSDC
jgi:phenylpropionate dioxygenase-like ring-hydroxylating dioxygenase large terminal subunit